MILVVACVTCDRGYQPLSPGENTVKHPVQLYDDEICSNNKKQYKPKKNDDGNSMRGFSNSSSSNWNSSAGSYSNTDRIMAAATVAMVLAMQ
jgi:hypothetical protein